MNRKTWIFALIALALILGIGGFLLWQNLPDSKDSSVDLQKISLESALEDWDNEKYAQSFAKLRALAKDKTTGQDPIVHFEYGRAAEALEQKEEAAKAFESAWNLGKADHDTLLARFRAYPNWSDEKRRSEALGWLDQVSNRDQQMALRAEILFETGDFSSSLQAWLQLWEMVSEPSAEWFSRTAVSFAATDDYANGAQWLEQMESKYEAENFWRPENYILTATFHALNADPQKARQAIHRGSQKFPKDPALALRAAELELSLNDYSAAANFLRPWIVNDTSGSGSGENPSPSEMDPELARRIRLMFAFLSNLDPSISSAVLKRLNQMEDSARAEGERAVYEALGLNREQELNRYRDLIQKAASLLPEEVIPNFLDAQEKVAVGSMQEALVLLDRSRNPIIALWGPWAIVRAEALLGLSRQWAALETLNQLHARGFYNETSLTLALNIQETLLDRTGAAKTRNLIESSFGSNPDYRFSKAMQQLDDNDFSNSIQELRNLTDSYPTESRYASGLAQALMRSGQIESARQLVSTYSSWQPGESELMTARIEAISGNTQNAKEAFLKACSIAPGAESAINALSFFLESELFTEAGSLINQMQQKFPNQPWPRMALALLKEAQGDLQTAKSIAGQLSNEYPGLYEAPALLARIASNESEWETVRLRALEGLRAIKSIVPSRTGLFDVTEADLHAWLGAAILNQGDAAAAKAALEEAIILDPEHRLTLRALANSEFALQQYNSALQRLTKLRRLDPDYWSADDSTLQFRCLLELRRYNEARQVLEGDATLLGSAVGILSARLEEQTGNVQKALDTLSQPPTPDLAQVYERNWIYTQLRSGDFQAGWNRAKTSTQLLATDWANIASMALNHSESAVAIQALEKSIQQDSENPVALNNLAYLLMDRAQEDDLSNAQSHATHALSLSPNDSNIADTLARIYLKANRFQDLQRLAQNWSAKDLSDPIWFYFMGRAEAGLGNRAKALEYLQKAKVLLITDLQGVSKQEVDSWIQKLDSTSQKQ